MDAAGQPIAVIGFACFNCDLSQCAGSRARLPVFRDYLSRTLCWFLLPKYLWQACLESILHIDTCILHLFLQISIIQLPIFDTQTFTRRNLRILD